MHIQSDTRLTDSSVLTPVTGGSIRLSPVTVERFDEYTIIAKLGHGGMAEVFLGLADGPSGFRKLLAIKRLHKHLEDDPLVVDMFLREAKLAARLQHANVVQTHKLGNVRGRRFIAMEYLDGQPLSRILARLRAQGAPLPAALAVRLISDALEGLHYAHEARDYDGTALSVIHRDVSPHNIFVTLDGQVKLLDFGIAKIGALDVHTRTGLIKGKLGYIAPEQARGELLDRRADVWSMGVTLWECLAGQRLFRGSTDASVLRATLTDDVPWLTELAPHVPEELSQIVDRALCRDREQRPLTALAFKESLDEWLGSQSAASSHALLSAMMKALFSDLTAQRQQALRACLERVEAERRAQAPKPPMLPLGHQPDTARAPAASAAPAAQARHVRWKLVTVASAVAVAALLGWLRAREVRPAASMRSLLAEASPSLAHAAEPTAPTQAPGPAAQGAPEQASLTDAIDTAVRADQLAADMAKGVAAPAQKATNVHRPRRPAWHAEPHTPLRAVEPTRAATDERTEDPAAPVPAAEPATERVTQPVEATRAIAPGRLLLDSTPYAVVSLGDKRLGITPIEVELPAGTHTLSLRNPEQGIETTYRVTIAVGATVKRRIAID